MMKLYFNKDTIFSYYSQNNNNAFILSGKHSIRANSWPRRLIMVENDEYARVHAGWCPVSRAQSSG